MPPTPQSYALHTHSLSISIDLHLIWFVCEWLCVCVCLSVILLFGAPCISLFVCRTRFNAICIHQTVHCIAILVFFVGRLNGSRDYSFFSILLLLLSSFQYIHNVIVCGALVHCTYAAPAAVLVDRGYIRHTKHSHSHWKFTHWIFIGTTLSYVHNVL